MRVIACALLALATASGCRTAAPRRVASAPPAPPPPPVTYVVEARPRVLVMPEAGVFLVLAAGPRRSGARLAWSVTYVAAEDRGAATADGAGGRLRFVADAIFRSQQGLAEAAGATRLSITALFGAPGEPGVSQELGYERTPAGWRRSDAPVAGEVASMPGLPVAFERSEADERTAVEVALRFLSHIDRLELDEAWDLASVVLKATMSRATFEQQLLAARPRDDAEPREELFRSFDLGPFVPGADLEIEFARPQALEAIQLRLDDDLEWRVAALGTFARGERPPRSTTAAAARP